MKIRVQKWGNSLAVRIPKSFAEELRYADNSPAEMTFEDGAILIRPDRDQVFDLDTLMAAVTDENIHSAWGGELAESRENSASGAEDRGGTVRSGEGVR
jgi:antitoxin MazE